MSSKHVSKHLTKVVAGLFLFTLALSPQALQAADNTATGNIAGVDGDLDDSNTFTLNSVTLALVKAAFLANGTALNSGDTLAKGTLVKFLIYVDNSSDATVQNINVADVLDAGFAYAAGTIKVDASQDTGASAADIYTAVNAAAALTDAVSGVDVAGITGATVSAGASAGNAQVDVAAGKVWALLFNATIQ